MDKKFIWKPHLKWKLPPKIALSSDWHVAAGEESEEANSQKYREKRVHEALYLHISHIPPSPSSPSNVQEVHLGESQIPLIPITPIEEDQPPEGNDSSTPADVELAAATVASALMKSKESGNCIDTNLLVQILSDPNAVQKLISDVGASGSRKSEPETKLQKINTPLAISNTGKREEVCSELEALNRSVEKSSSKFYTAPTKKNEENTTVLGKGKASFSTSDQVKCELGSFDGRVAPVPRANSMSSQFTFRSQSDLEVQKSNSSRIMPIAPDLDEFKWTNSGYNEPTETVVKPISGSLASFPYSKTDLGKFNWMGNGYEVPNKTDDKPFPRSDLFAPEVTIMRPNVDIGFPTSMNVYPLPSERHTHSLLKAVLSDAVRPTDSRLMSTSPDASRLNLYSSSNQVQQGLHSMVPFPNQARPGLQTNAPFPNQLEFGSQIMGRKQFNAPMSTSSDASRLNLYSSLSGLQNMPQFPNKARPILETNAPFPNQLKLGSQIMGHTQVNAPTPFPLPSANSQIQGNNYFKSLVQQHGKIQEAPRYNLSFPQQNPNLVPPYCNPNVQAVKIQRPCFFFNRPEGCKLGDTCPYLHNAPQNLQFGSAMGASSTKRMKMDGTIFTTPR